MNVAVIPVYNEEKHISHVIKETEKYIDKIVVVDDGSTDNTTKNINPSKKVHLLKHIVNMGKGVALKTGTEYAIKKLGAENIIFLDGDSQHNPHNIPLFLNAIKSCDIVFGCRKLNKKMPFIFRLGNFGLNKIISFLTGIYIPDTQSGFRAIKAKIYPLIVWESSDYSVESEMIALVGKNKLRYKIVWIDTIYNDRYKGTTIFDGIKIFINLILWKLK